MFYSNVLVAAEKFVYVVHMCKLIFEVSVQ